MDQIQKETDRTRDLEVRQRSGILQRRRIAAAAADIAVVVVQLDPGSAVAQRPVGKLGVVGPLGVGGSRWPTAAGKLVVVEVPAGEQLGSVVPPVVEVLVAAGYSAVGQLGVVQ